MKNKDKMTQAQRYMQHLERGNQGPMTTNDSGGVRYDAPSSQSGVFDSDLETPGEQIDRLFGTLIEITQEQSSYIESLRESIDVIYQILASNGLLTNKQTGDDYGVQDRVERTTSSTGVGYVVKKENDGDSN